MAKKPLKIKTKLSNDIAPGTDQENAFKAEITPTRISKKLFLKNYRLRGLDIQRLEEIVKAVNDLSTSRMTETDVIKSLIYLGSKSKKERIIKAYKASL